MKLSNLRKITQVLGFAGLNLGFTTTLKIGVVCPALYCYACPLAMFACPFGTLQHFVALSVVPLYAGGTISLFSTLLGRTYCSWLCPFGAFQDIVGILNKKKVKLRTIPWAKFAVLGIALIAAYLTTETVFCRYCPSGSLFGALPYVFISGLSPIPFGVWVHVATLLIVIAGVLFVERVWCRYLCPMGAIFGAFNRASVLSMRVNSEICVNCGACLKSCPMGISDVKAIGVSTDCTRCGKCVESCPRNAISYSIGIR